MYTTSNTTQANDAELVGQPPPDYTPDTSLEPPVQSQDNRLPTESELADDRPMSVYRVHTDGEQPPPPYIGKPPPYTPRLSRWDKFRLSVRRHKKWWLCALLLLVAVSIVVPCVIVFGVYKKYTQDYIKKVRLDNTYSRAEFAFSEEYPFAIKYHDTLAYPQNDTDRREFVLDTFKASMLLEDQTGSSKPFATFTHPGLENTHTDSYHINQSFRGSKLDYDETARLMRRLIHENEVKVGIKGTAKGKLSGLPEMYDVAWRQTLPLVGFGGFPEYKNLGSSNFSGANFNSIHTPNRDESFDFSGAGRLSNVNSTGDWDGDDFVSRTTVGLSSIGIDVYDDGGDYMGHGNITLAQLPDLDGSDVYIRLNGTYMFKIVEKGKLYDQGMMPWHLRFVRVNGGDGSESNILTNAMRDMGVKMYVNVALAAEYFYER